MITAAACSFAFGARASGNDASAKHAFGNSASGNDAFSNND